MCENPFEYEEEKVDEQPIEKLKQMMFDEVRELHRRQQMQAGAATSQQLPSSTSSS